MLAVGRLNRDVLPVGGKSKSELEFRFSNSVN